MTKKIEREDLALGESQIQPSVHGHSPEPGHVENLAPSLWNIVGQPKASVPDMDYSDALQQETGVWDYGVLDIYLADVCGSVPGFSHLRQCHAG